MVPRNRHRGPKPLMDRNSQATAPHFAQPLRPILSMVAVIGLVSAGVWIGRDVILGIFEVNPWLNGFIAGVFLLGVFTCFWQLVQLAQSVVWIKGFVGRKPGFDAGSAPQLLAPLAALLAQRAARMQISTISQRSILDSVATRLDEAREITRYLGNLLIFLGLLGTFYGLATTIPAMVETIRNLAPQEGESGVEVFSKLMKGLESQLGGMGTAFSSSLLGLAGSLMVGLLDLFAGHGQNRFYRELEEWSSTITRVGLAPSDGGGETEVAAGSGILTEQLESLAAVIERGEAARGAADARVVALIGTIDRLAARLDAAIAQGPDQTARQDRTATAQVALLDRIAAGQEAAAASLAALAAPEGGPHVDAESRMRLRSIDVQLLRILEEISAGRQESISDLRGDLATLTAAVRQLGRGAGAR